ncbi:hypothetical protein [Acetobacter oeni]|uniref:DUF2147 domain-containing protein n=1 Tax=Acetobacter oeni TaxID=304077 RepID=A0A511XN49_9PROT|nr:hypothetical protein [Acetobacter oeni]MBB3884212.1 hypothetical protein [Acetobacter oeni]NHO20194.1 hypothetical protein [Acetobacter oeni]GBR05566.1 hypothetical protein AA21952_1762 [Acetobacter oeni LMG 21952]GEN64363.1 hypothetical protein AOE01nite_25870 [Acetobacter oeni]
MRHSPHLPRTGHARRLALTTFIALGAALHFAPSARAASDAQSDPTGLWTGTLVTDQGNCPDQMESTLQIEPSRIAFTPGTGALILHGKPDKDHKHFHAQLMLTDMKKKPLPMVFEGHPDGQTITGEFGTPTCRAHIVMKRPESHTLDNFLGR